MSTRFIIPILIAGAFAFACGPRTHSEASSAAPAALATVQKVSGLAKRPQRTASRTDSKVTSSLQVRVDTGIVRFALSVTNGGKKGVEINFPNGQEYDFAVLDTLGRQIWRWGDGRMFTQTLKNKMLDKGETLNRGEDWQLNGRTGRFTVVATLKSSNFPQEQRAEFVVP